MTWHFRTSMMYRLAVQLCFWKYMHPSVQTYLLLNFKDFRSNLNRVLDSFSLTLRMLAPWGLCKSHSTVVCHSDDEDYQLPYF